MITWIICEVSDNDKAHVLHYQPLSKLLTWIHNDGMTIKQFYTKHTDTGQWMGIRNASDILILIRAQVYVLICLWVWLILTLYY